MKIEGRGRPRRARIAPKRVQLSRGRKFSTLPSADVLRNMAMVEEVLRAREEAIKSERSESSDRGKKVAS